MSPEPRVLSASELHVGLSDEFERDLTEADVLAFAGLSGDHNPLHVDATYALATNYQGRIAHGALQVGLASRMLGMHLPGRSALFVSANARFLAPLYFPCRVRVRGEITAWNSDNHRGTLDVVVRHATTLVPTAEIVIGFTLHQQSEAAAPRGEVAAPRTTANRRRVLVTGAAGGIGRSLVASIARRFAVIAMVNRAPLDGALAALPGVTEVRADLDAPGWEEHVRAAVGAGGLYGVVHAAWPGAPAGGLLSAQDDVVARQVLFGTTQTIRLARLLFSLAESQGRLVVLGSVVGSARPTINLAAYSLGKASVESTVRLLAPELARKGITVNAVCPTFVATGINKHANDRQQLKEAALIPMGRLCSAEDVVGTVEYLLSEQAAFVSGQLIGLSGGQL